MPERTESDIRMELAEQRSRQKDARDEIHLQITNVRNLRTETGAIKTQRDKGHDDARKLHEEAKAHQDKRDEINQMVADLRQKKRAVTSELRGKIDVLISAKKERGSLNRQAGATRDALEKQVTGGLKTIFGMDMALKNEAVMFEMLFEWRDKLGLKDMADQAHHKLQEGWEKKVKVEEEAQSLYAEIGRLIEASNHEHGESIRLFQERDETRATANDLHKTLLDKSKDVKATQKAIDNAKAKADKIGKKVRDLEKELIKKVGYRRAKEDQRKFEGVKEKMDAGNKMSMDDLKLLLDKGALK